MNSRNYLQAGDARSFAVSGRTGDADELLCKVGSVISAGLPGRLPRKELFEAHAVATLVKLGQDQNALWDFKNSIVVSGLPLPSHRLQPRPGRCC